MRIRGTEQQRRRVEWNKHTQSRPDDYLPTTEVKQSPSYQYCSTCLERCKRLCDRREGPTQGRGSRVGEQTWRKESTTKRTNAAAATPRQRRRCLAGRVRAVCKCAKQNWFQKLLSFTADIACLLCLLFFARTSLVIAPLPCQPAP